MTAYEIDDLFRNQLAIMRALQSLLQSNAPKKIARKFLHERIVATIDIVLVIDQQQEAGRQ